jgi:hypothetical protein
MMAFFVINSTIAAGNSKNRKKIEAENPLQKWQVGSEEYLGSELVVSYLSLVPL